MLKIKLLLSEKRYAAVAEELIASGHVIDDNAELLLTERPGPPAAGGGHLHREPGP